MASRTSSRPPARRITVKEGRAAASKGRTRRSAPADAVASDVAAVQRRLDDLSRQAVHRSDELRAATQYAAVAPLGNGVGRYAAMAGIAAGSAIAQTEPGREVIAQRLRVLANARGQQATVAAALDLAGAAIAWAALLEPADADWPLIPGGEPLTDDRIREGGLQGNGIAAAQRRAITDVRMGRVTSLDLIAGRALAATRRAASTVRWSSLVAVDPLHGVERAVSIARSRDVHFEIVVGELSVDERSTIVEALA